MGNAPRPRVAGQSDIRGESTLGLAIKVQRLSFLRVLPSILVGAVRNTCRSGGTFAEGDAAWAMRQLSVLLVTESSGVSPPLGLHERKLRSKVIETNFISFSM